MLTLNFPNPATTKLQWANNVIAALGNSRRVRCLLDGVEFLNVGLTGPITTLGGNITSIGKVKGITTKNVVDLSTGTGVLRIEGNGKVVEGTLGLPGSGCDFILSGNLTANSGVGFVSGIRIKAPKWLPSGTGFLTPSQHPKTPAGVRIWDYADEANPVLTGTCYASVRDDDIVLDVPWMAAQFGDIKLMHTPVGGGVVLGTGGDAYLFGMAVASMNSEVNNDASEPMHAVRVRAMPHGRWASWPFRKDLNRLVDTMAPLAFKGELFAVDGTTLEWFELTSTRVNGVPGTGKPINHAGQKAEHWNQGCQPFWTCAMELTWESHKPKENEFFRHVCPGVTLESRNPKNLSAFGSFSDRWPLLTRNQANWSGLGHVKYAPKWARKHAGGLDTNIVDPNMAFAQVIRENYRTQFIGWGFEPGSTCLRTWYNGDGGPRQDRALWSHITTMHASEPNGVRIHGAVPWEEMHRDFLRGAANEGVHFFTDVEQGIGINKQKSFNSDYFVTDAYYGDPNKPDAANNSFRQLIATNGKSYDNGYGFKDKYGRPFTNEWSKDVHHSMMSGADSAYMLRSAHGILEAPHSFHFLKMVTYDINEGFQRSVFLTRQSAWYIATHAKCWVASSSHPKLISASEYENSMKKWLEQMYDVMQPLSLEDSIRGHALRNLGMVFEPERVGDLIYLRPNSDHKTYYHGALFMFMKQTGFLAAMKAKSAKCAWILDFMMECLAKQAVGIFVDCNGRWDNNAAYVPDYSSPADAFVHPQHWGQICPPNNLLDWIRKPTGEIGGRVSGYETFTPDNYNTKHMRAQFLYILRDYFPEMNVPRLDQAIAVMQGYYDEIAASTTHAWSYRIASFGFFNPPAYVGPPVLAA
jgi:hypothetical protein